MNILVVLFCATNAGKFAGIGKNTAIRDRIIKLTQNLGSYMNRRGIPAKRNFGLGTFLSPLYDDVYTVDTLDPTNLEYDQPTHKRGGGDFNARSGPLVAWFK